jgi:hypothetical protein
MRGEAAMMRIGRASFGPRYSLSFRRKRFGTGMTLAAFGAASLLLFAASEIAKEQAYAPPAAPPSHVNAIKPAVARSSDEAKASPARADNLNDRQRRLLMLLLMNSAGPMRPYGNLGR